MKEKLIDLHTHSTCSDGSMTPTELVDHAAERGLAAIALSDHDSVAGVKEAMAKLSFSHARREVSPHLMTTREG